MTTIHAQRIGDKALVPLDELERLVDLAKQSGEIELQVEDDDLPTLAIMRLAEQGRAFDFWHEEGEDIYSEADGEPV
jgi:hypothetical protein